MGSKTFEGLLYEYVSDFTKSKEKHYKFKTQILTPPNGYSLWGSNVLDNKGNKNKARLQIIWIKKR